LKIPFKLKVEAFSRINRSVCRSHGDSFIAKSGSFMDNKTTSCRVNTTFLSGIIPRQCSQNTQ